MAPIGAQGEFYRQGCCESSRQRRADGGAVGDGVQEVARVRDLKILGGRRCDWLLIVCSIDEAVAREIQQSLSSLKENGGVVVAEGEDGGLEVQVPLSILDDRAYRVGILEVAVELIVASEGGGALRCGIVEHPLGYIDPVGEDVCEEAAAVVGEGAPGGVAGVLVGNFGGRSEEEVPVEIGGF